jgi:hypothetical protein
LTTTSPRLAEILIMEGWDTTHVGALGRLGEREECGCDGVRAWALMIRHLGDRRAAWALDGIPDPVE